MKINIVMVANIVGTALGVAGTILTGFASQKRADDTIAKKVAEEVAKHVNK